MKKLVKPEISCPDQEINALCEYSGSCANFCESQCLCQTKGFWADDDKDEILF